MRCMKTRTGIHSSCTLLALSLFLVLAYLPFLVNGEGGATLSKPRAALPLLLTKLTNSSLNISLFYDFEDLNLVESCLPKVDSFQNDHGIDDLEGQKDKVKGEDNPKEIEEIMHSDQMTTTQNETQDEKHPLLLSYEEINGVESEANHSENSPRDSAEAVNQEPQVPEAAKKQEEHDEKKSLHKPTEMENDDHLEVGSEDAKKQQGKVEILGVETAASNDSHIEMEPQEQDQLSFNGFSLQNASQENVTENASQLENRDQHIGESYEDLVYSENIVLSAIDKISVCLSELKREMKSFSGDSSWQRSQLVEAKAVQDLLHLLDLVKEVGEQVSTLQLNLEAVIKPNVGHKASDVNSSSLTGEVAVAPTDTEDFLAKIHTKKAESNMPSRRLDDASVSPKVESNNEKNLCNTFPDSVHRRSIRYYLSINQRAVVEELEAVGKKSGVQIDLCEPNSFFISINSVRTACLFVGFYVLAAVLGIMRINGVRWRRKSIHRAEGVKTSTFSSSKPVHEEPFSSFKVNSENLLPALAKPPRDAIIESPKMESASRPPTNLPDRTEPPRPAMPPPPSLLSEPRPRGVPPPPIPPVGVASKGFTSPPPWTSSTPPPSSQPTRTGLPCPPIDRSGEFALPQGREPGQEWRPPVAHGGTAVGPTPAPPGPRLGEARQAPPGVPRNPNGAPQRQPTLTPLAPPAPSRGGGGEEEEDDDICELRNPFLSRWS
ncbi:unnamed protein product [Phytomonas sp. EM1]|nr:unnamed protein product [Phytomonas sp. EM1]|eukprot:CCW60749.1 unnamed protein product [Phytomonas sp. isolate EM1]